MFKIDETYTYTDQKVRWNSQDDKIYGLCYEHGRDKDLTFTSMSHIEELATQVSDGTLHVSKETMVIASSSNSLQNKAQVLAALRTCTKFK